MGAIAFLFFSIISAAQAGQMALSKYDDIQKDILSRRVTLETVAKAADLFPRQRGFLDALQNLATVKRNRESLDVASRHAYFEFIKLPASADVLYDFLAEQDAAIAKFDKSNDPGDILAWSWAYAAQAEVDAFAATSDDRYLDIFVRGAKEAFANTDRARGFKDMPTCCGIQRCGKLFNSEPLSTILRRWHLLHARRATPSIVIFQAI